MDGPKVLAIVGSIQSEKQINPDIVFEGIEAAILAAARKHYGEEADLTVSIDRQSGEPTVVVEGRTLVSDDIGDLIGRIGAQTAKQVIIQKIREAERDTLFDEFGDFEMQVVTGTVTRMERGSAIVTLGKAEAMLPRSEMIPGETHRPNERIRAIVLEVSKQGSKLKIILSRRHPEFVRRLFETEIPEVSDHVIEVRSLAREAGYRSKVAVSCFDSKVDPIGACVGQRGSRIRNVIDELNGERIDIVRWNDSLQVLVPNALEPAKVEDVILCPMLGKVIVLVQDDQLSLAIGKKGQNVRLASKLVGWDIDVLTQEKLDEQIDRTLEHFLQAPHVTEELVEKLIEEGFFTFDDLSVIEPDLLQDLSGLTEEECDEIVEFADRRAEEMEKANEQIRQMEREARRLGIDLSKPKSPPKPSPPAEETPEEPSVETEAAENSDSEAATDEEKVAEADDSSDNTEEAAVADPESTSEPSPGDRPSTASAEATPNAPVTEEPTTTEGVEDVTSETTDEPEKEPTAASDETA